MTVDDIIERMRNGERLRWLAKSESGRLRSGCVNYRELWIGRDIVYSNVTAFDVVADERIVESDVDGHYELKETV